MMAVRERAVKVMAALDRRVPSLDDFVGQSWSAWTEWAGVTAADGEQTLERRQRCSRGRLMKAPRHIFVQMKRRANHVTQTKTLPGPSAGWVTCFAPPAGSLIKRYIQDKIIIYREALPCCCLGRVAVANKTASVSFGDCGNSRAVAASERKEATSYR